MRFWFYFSVLTPIAKNKYDNVTATSNCPIALATVFSKLFEQYILYMLKEFLVSVDNQFDFKSSHSINMCLFFIKASYVTI